MSRFENIIDFTLSWEGGYVNDIDDAGGETKFGISKRSYPYLNIKNLTIEQAKEIYVNDFWKYYMNVISSYKISGRLFDLSVNMGQKGANKLLQRAVNLLGKNLVVDGVIGPISIAAINNSDDEQLYNNFYNLAKDRYERIATRKKYEKFLDGWMNRLNAPFNS